MNTSPISQLRTTLLMLAYTSCWTGCVPALIPLPPPTSTATSLTQVAPGHMALDAGVAPTVDFDQVPALSLDTYTGTIPVALRYGLDGHRDLSLTVGVHAFGPLAGAQFAFQVLETDAFRLGMTTGLGIFEQHGEYETYTPPLLDENGNQVLNEDGDPVSEYTTVKYAVVGLAPALGLRAQWRVRPRLSLVSAVRVSWSQLIPLYGVTSGFGVPFLEPDLGAVLEPLPGLSVGLSARLGWPMLPWMAASSEPNPWSIVPTLSASYAFPVR